MPSFERLGADLAIFRDGVNVGILTHGNRGLAIDCGAGAVVEALPELGIEHLDWVLATHHHRDGCSALPRCLRAGARLAVPAAERGLFDEVERYWDSPDVQFHRYQLRPDGNVLARSVPVARELADGETVDWEQAAIRVVATPGHTDGSLSYVVESGGIRYAFVGDLLYGDGQLWQLWSLQGPPPGQPVGSQDYHGFCGRARQAVRSLERLLAAFAPEVLIPAHGPIIRQPAAALAALRGNVEALLANYYATSSMRYYFPDWTARQRDGGWEELPGRLATPPSWYRTVGNSTTRAIVSATGRALLFDCAGPRVAEVAAKWVAAGTISGVDAVWISHYHDDHVGGIAALVEKTGCAVWAHRGLVDVLAQPAAYCLPCLDPAAIRVDRILEEGERVAWQEFTLSAYDFPGQTILHSALLIEREGLRLLIAGDAFTPGGLDDYCAQNRNLLGAGRGYERCLDLLETLRPDLLVNMHVPLPFALPPSFLAQARGALRERERLLGGVLPWPHPNFGLDPQWARTYPYRQALAAGTPGRLGVQVSNSGPASLTLQAALDVPDGWQTPGPAETTIAPGSEGAIELTFSVSASAPAGRYVLPVRLRLDGLDLGAWSEGLVDVTNAPG